MVFYKDGNCMYIGICDWKFASRVNPLHTSKYIYGIAEEMNKNKAKQLWVYPTLFTIYK